MSGGLIRHARPDELPDIAVLWGASWESIGISNEHDLSGQALIDHLRREVADSWDLYVYEEAAALLAMLAIVPDRNNLSQIFVAPSAQSRGLGKQLLQFAKTLMPQEIHLNTQSENTRALRWYLKEGFEITGTRFNETYQREVIDMVWRA